MALWLWFAGCGVFSEAQGFEPCTLSPDPGSDITTLRVGPDGTVWLHDGSNLYRYDDVGSDACELEGELFWAEGDFDAVTDFELDADGRPHILVFFDQVMRLADDGTAEVSCEIDAGHGMAVSDDGGTAWVISVGESTLHSVALDDCSLGEPVDTEHGMSTHPTWTPDGIAVDAHDAGGTLPPGWLVDPATGSFDAELGLGPGPDETELFGMSDLVPADGGYWIAGTPDGDLWWVDADGQIGDHTPLDDILAEEVGDMVNLLSIARSNDGPDYIAAGHVGPDGVWRTEIE